MEIDAMALRHKLDGIAGELKHISQERLFHDDCVKRLDKEFERLANLYDETLEQWPKEHEAKGGKE